MRGACGQCLQDTSQYVLSELAALETEQKHIDNRAAVVERRLRGLMETGLFLTQQRDAFNSWKLKGLGGKTQSEVALEVVWYCFVWLVSIPLTDDLNVIFYNPTGNLFQTIYKTRGP